MNIIIEQAKVKESSNNGTYICLYENETVGAVEAYGYSAYLAARMLKNPLSIFSTEYDMPSVVLRKKDVEQLAAFCTVHKDDNSTIMHVNEPKDYDPQGYELWINKLQGIKSKSLHAARLEAMTMADDLSAQSKKNNIMGFSRMEVITVAIASVVALVVILLLLFFSF